MTLKEQPGISLSMIIVAFIECIEVYLLRLNRPFKLHLLSSLHLVANASHSSRNAMALVDTMHHFTCGRLNSREQAVIINYAE